MAGLVQSQNATLASVKSRLLLLFWYWLTRVVLDKGPLNWCVCVVNPVYAYHQVIQQ